MHVGVRNYRCNQVGLYCIDMLTLTPCNLTLSIASYMCVPSVAICHYIAGEDQQTAAGPDLSPLDL
jgi:hypothetical protein